MKIFHFSLAGTVCFGNVAGHCNFERLVDKLILSNYTYLSHCEFILSAWGAVAFLRARERCKSEACLCTGQFQNRPSTPGQTPGHLTFLKNFGQIPRYVASLDGQMPHPLELQRGSNSPPSRHAKATVETISAKFSVTTNFLFSLSSLHTLNKGIFHYRTI